MRQYLTLLTILVSINSFGHSGGTNSSGCHNNTKTGDYHCHNKKSSSAGGGSSSVYSNDYSRARSSSASAGASSKKYNRAQFGKGWDDADGDCQNSRHEALIAQSTAPVRFKSGRNCKVTAGRWISPFTGAVIHDPSKIDIDHVVPLKWAWERGASQWSYRTRQRFANDQANLLSVEASLNRQKGAKGLDKWLPPANRCQYVARFMRLVKSYDLYLTPSERNVYSQIRQQACR